MIYHRINAVFSELWQVHQEGPRCAWKLKVESCIRWICPSAAFRVESVQYWLERSYHYESELRMCWNRPVLQLTVIMLNHLHWPENRVPSQTFGYIESARCQKRVLTRSSWSRKEDVCPFLDLIHFAVGLFIKLDH